MGTPEATPARPQDVGARELRRAMGSFPTGVAIVMTESRDGPHGATVNSLTCVSLDPPLILVSLRDASRTARAVEEAGRYAVSILGARQQPVANTFAEPGGDRFTGLDVHRGATGLPVVPGALAALECSVARRLDIGDHTVFFGRVHHLTHRGGTPLVFHAGRFGGLLDPGLLPETRF
ncbi:flavin reductase family protein [Streptomyces sp. NPDC047000]|uniref:flavin reductase family protein n=1 Tax=Streptomyces sp. NPDC047000 TaxID=3155474 RepID=UPI0033F798B7